MSATRSPLRRPSACSAPPYRLLARSRAVNENDASLDAAPAPKPGTPASEMNRKPSVGSALAASSMASASVLKLKLEDMNELTLYWLPCRSSRPRKPHV